MPQIQVFQCPACGANLSYDGGPEISFACQFCGTSIIVPEELRARAGQPPPSQAGTPASGAAMPGGLPLAKLAEIKALAQNGRLIEAIKLYREVTGLGLAEAKAAVEQLAAGEPLVYTSTGLEASGVDSSDRAAQLAEVARLARSGQKIEAASLLRQVAPTMPEAAVERSVNVMAGQGNAVTSAAPAMPVAPARRASSCSIGGCLAVLAVLIVGGLAAGFAFLPTRMADIFPQAFPSATATPNPTRASNVTPGLSGLQINSTAAAKSKATQRALSTQTAAVTASQAALEDATATAEAATTATAVEDAAATAGAASTAQVISTTQAAWPRLISDNFADNRLGWPTGPANGSDIGVTVNVKGKKYAWAVTPKGSAYASAFPLNTTSLSDFSATVKVKFVQSPQDDNVAVGLMFRHSDPDYSFFGIDPTGQYLVEFNYSGGSSQTITGASTAILTQANQVNQLTVQAVGSDFVFLINNQVVSQITQDVSDGDVGVGVEVKGNGKPVQAEFSEFDVHSPKP